MKRLRLANDNGFDTWVCENCLEAIEKCDIEFDVIDRDNDEYDDGCNECGCCHSDQLDSED